MCRNSRKFVPLQNFTYFLFPSTLASWQLRSDVWRSCWRINRGWNLPQIVHTATGLGKTFESRSVRWHESNFLGKVLLKEAEQWLVYSSLTGEIRWNSLWIVVCRTHELEKKLKFKFTVKWHLTSNSQCIVFYVKKVSFFRLARCWVHFHFYLRFCGSQKNSLLLFYRSLLNYSQNLLM